MTFGLRDLTAGEHAQHPFHTGARAFSETNCYVDVWIGMLHALGLEAEACLGFGLASDFEGDQWTFVKPSHGDLARLYGIQVEELSLWRPLVEHVEHQVARGRIPLIELDAYYLPDTQATDYRRAHVKTTVGIAFVDIAARRMRYFHNAGFFELEGADFDGVFRLDRSTPDDYLPPYCEVVKLDALQHRSNEQLRALARELSAHHYAMRPKRNPVSVYASCMNEHMQWIVAGDDAAFHRYSFSSLRQLGTSFETLAAHLQWLDAGRGGHAHAAAQAFEQIPSVAKRLILKLARVANSKRVADLSESFGEMSNAWERGMDHVALALSE